MGFILAFSVVLLPCLVSVRGQFDPSKVYEESAAVFAHFKEPAEPINSPAFHRNPPVFTSQMHMELFIKNLTDINENLSVTPIGNSQLGRYILLLEYSKNTTIKKPTVLIIGQQHGNEMAGGEAALAIAEELATSNGSLLEKLNVLIVPRANPDGAIKYLRGLTNGDDVNRDHLLLQSPEGQALASVFRQRSPDVVMDCHEFTVASRWLSKFGGVQKIDGMLQYATVPNLPPNLTVAADLVHKAILNKFQAANITQSWYYTSSTNNSDKVVSMGGVGPDTGRNIAGLRNAISFLLETRGTGIGLAHFKRRVFTHLIAIRAILQSVSENAETVLAYRKMLDAEVAGMTGKGMITVLGSQTPENRSIELLHGEDGSTMTLPVDWRSSLVIRNDLTRTRPFGYVLNSSETKAVQVLQRLGVSVYHFVSATTVKVEKYNVISVKEVKKQDVTGSVGTFKSTVQEIRTTQVGASLSVPVQDYYVPLDQALANIVVTALEPESQSSFPANYIMFRFNGTLVVGDELPFYRVTEKPETEKTLLEFD